MKAFSKLSKMTYATEYQSLKSSISSNFAYQGSTLSEGQIQTSFGIQSKINTGTALKHSFTAQTF